MGFLYKSEWDNTSRACDFGYDAIMPTELKLHHCIVDLTGARVRWPEREVSLTDAEAKLLAFMVERRSEDISRGELLEHVWGYSPTVRSRAVDQTVKRLRRKIEADPSAPDSLLSVYGVGYRLVLPVEESVERLTMTPGRLPRIVGETWGRTAVLTELSSASQDGRAIVLTGPPGVGKSRIALAHAAAVRAQADPSGGVWVVDCDPTRSIAGLMSSIQYTLSVAGGETTSPAALAELIDRRGPALVAALLCVALLVVAALPASALVEAGEDRALRVIAVQAHLQAVGQQHALALVERAPRAAEGAVKRWRLATPDQSGRAVGEDPHHALHPRDGQRLVHHVPAAQHLVLAVAYRVGQSPIFRQSGKAELRHGLDAVASVNAPLHTAVALLVVLLLIHVAVLHPRHSTSHGTIRGRTAGLDRRQRPSCHVRQKAQQQPRHGRPRGLESTCLSQRRWLGTTEAP